jgi:TM2 domain-containing membrane protein YozV
MTEPRVNLRNPAVAALLAWLVPGLGHFYQRRIGKGILYAVCIFGLYLMGMLMGEGRIVYWRWVNPMNNPEKFCLYYLGQFFVGIPSVLSVIQSTLHLYGHDSILWGFMAEPLQNDLNAMQTRLGKLVEIGSIYTCIAGLLNILAIYDAYEGPAYQEQDEDAAAEAATQVVPAGRIPAEGSA